MTNPSAALFDITAWIEAQDSWAGPHKVLYLEAPPDAHHQGTYAEKLTAHRWRVGIIARVSLHLLQELADARTATRHGCATMYDRDYGDGYACGLLSARYLTDQRHTLAAGDSGDVGIVVPDDQADQWLARAHQLTSEVITADAAPGPDPVHRRVILTEHATETKETST